jgi:hypothetical protein
MRIPYLCSLVTLLAPLFVMALPSLCRAEPAHHESIEWATANSDRVVVGKVIKAETVDKHDIVTVEVHRTLRGKDEAIPGAGRPMITFVVQQYCSGPAQGWLEDQLPMMFFLVKINGAKRSDQLPNGIRKSIQWVLHENGNGNSAVSLGKTNRDWPGTIDVFTRRFDHLTDPKVIMDYVSDFARSIPADRVHESISVNVPWGTPAYEKVFPPQFPGNAFRLRVPVIEPKQPDGDATPAMVALLVLGAVGCGVGIWYMTRR